MNEFRWNILALIVSPCGEIYHRRSVDITSSYRQYNIPVVNKRTQFTVVVECLTKFFRFSISVCKKRNRNAGRLLYVCRRYYTLILSYFLLVLDRLPH